jgi:hypothetical protein
MWRRRLDRYGELKKPRSVNDDDRRLLHVLVEKQPP